MDLKIRTAALGNISSFLLQTADRRIMEGRVSIFLGLAAPAKGGVGGSATMTLKLVKLNPEKENERTCNPENALHLSTREPKRSFLIKSSKVMFVLVYV